MELRHLRYFVAVAEELSFSRAASRLFIAQPPLSQQIQQLEKEVGVQLFDRTKRRIQLTDGGAAFLKEAKAILAHVEQAIQTARRTERGEMGCIEIGFIGMATYDILPSILRAFRQHYPHVELELYELTEAEQVRALREGKIHVGLLRPLLVNESVKEFVFESISHQQLMVALPATHPLAKRDEIPLAALANEPFIGITSRQKPSFWDHLLLICGQAGFRPNVVQEAREVQTMISLVAADIGIALVSSAAQRLTMNNVVYRPIQGEAEGVELVVAYREDESAPVLKVFLEIVREIAQRLKKSSST